jgi:hypothetical protein
MRGEFRSFDKKLSELRRLVLKRPGWINRMMYSRAFFLEYQDSIQSENPTDSKNIELFNIDNDKIDE